ncbi:MAG: GNAT family N-acetyltransferase [Alphaproteobacteria bacterium]
MTALSVPVASSGQAAPAVGYAHPAYASTLDAAGDAAGRTISLAGSGGWLIERPIPGTDRSDAAAPYPLFCCRHWSALSGDLDDLAAARRLVSVVGVIDPFAPVDAGTLARAFPDLVRPYKEHHVVRLDRPLDRIATKHHRYYARRALRTLAVEPVTDLAGFAPQWAALYRKLVLRHGLRGLHAFSAQALGDQLAVPGAVAFCALADGQIVAAHVWYQQGEIAYSHLAASNEIGYGHAASYALHWEAIRYFAAAGVAILDLGGAADGGRDGLLAFKAGWANETRIAYLCGRIIDRKAYQDLAAARGGTAAGYFPSYRRPMG